MKKQILGGCTVILMSCFVQGAYANESFAVKTVKEMYTLGAKLEKGMEIIQLYADESLDRAFRHEAEYTEGICAYGHDLLWQSQDPEYNRKLSFTDLGSNRVRVNLGRGQWHEPGSVIFKMSCQGNTCKVNDVIDGGESIKVSIYEQCN